MAHQGKQEAAVAAAVQAILRGESVHFHAASKQAAEAFLDEVVQRVGAEQAKRLQAYAGGTVQ
jgi:hypothetical protein